MKNDQRSSVTLRLPPELRQWLGNIAEKHCTSINAEIVRSVRERAEKEKDETTV